MFINNTSASLTNQSEQSITHAVNKFSSPWILPFPYKEREKLTSLTALLLKDVRAQKFPRTDFFLNLPGRKVMIYYGQKGKKKWGVTDFVLERTCPEKYPKSEKSGFVS